MQEKIPKYREKNVGNAENLKKNEPTHQKFQTIQFEKVRKSQGKFQTIKKFL